MDGSQAPANQPIATPQQHSNLIRTDQVQKLPHLNEQQKAQHTQLVRNFWEILNSREPQSAEYQNAHMRLTQLSQNLMKGMRLFQHNRQQALQQHQQAQAAAAAAQGQPVQRTQSANPQSFNQLLPQIQQKVNGLQFFLPPNISKEQIQTWLPEARLRYGIALQKQEIGRVRISEMRGQFAQRQAAGNLSEEEVQDFKNRQLAAEKLFREGSEFLNKFKEQQETFKAQQNQQLNRAGLQSAGQAQTHPPQGTAEQTPAVTAAATPTAATPAPTISDKRPVNVPGQMHPGQAPTPAPHTINSAVNAARNQVGQAAMSPTPQPGQAPTVQTGGTAPAPSAVPPQQPLQLQQQQQPPQPPPPPPPQQPQPLSQQGASGAQVTFSQAPNPDGSTPTPTAPQPVNIQGPPRPLSHQAAMAQAAQNYTNNTANNNLGQPNVSQAAANPHAHPQGYIPNRGAENSARNINMAIPKNLNVPPPEPISMAPARPTLSGGPSHGAMGMMGQPAIQKHPGYVLEGEGQRVLSKKMLDILVRQVTGGGEGEGLTPDAEEFILQMADDFVDDVITAACRLAKLRPSSTLEIRDIQLVLERNYNMRISGFSTDDLRTVKKPQPTQGWTQKMSAVQAAKVTQGKAE
ncbi:putative transcription initiation factor TFIID subunit 12 [Aspergillus clavatus NRRL 1]|uniref:Transcription initiation factor TFIID subunit 12, putative n=1 Tax=Aspergillus clavatus (strain ATCC 1007 / CBS 513.65 / DSM 816 / NCTC 3887 / NRRL 1 / QM 1276 / 107) TaxID=344612 RepID=A1CJ78_ASPCL|nr:transcription initiation factor TFIID subunit 12, putative [Aspergillus clavatus NRRL 1]EAW09202.1 transcription initiation factor TFIID subunit 12, putative [Aspergillus clavatus NRRL 1]